MSTVYERIGGAPAIQAAVGGLYEKILGDPELAPFFDDIPMDEQRVKMAALLTMVTGGPNDYGGRNMRAAHAPLVAQGLDDSHFDAVLAHLSATIAELGVAQADVAEVARIAESTRDDVLGR